MSFSHILEVQPEVAVALSKNEAVVALESTIISHGMPYPKNVRTARAVEQTVRDFGAVPATIAILDGKIKVGLNNQDLELLGKTGYDVIKCSRRDLPFVVTQGKHGATTVAATMIIAEMAGIKVFATGGIGGVHRGATETMDISADLQELAQTNVAVVSAGAKAILDLGLTLEYLETHGVPVIGYQTNIFPAFYTSQSDFKVDYNIETPVEIAQILYNKWLMKLNGGVLIANPIPKEFEMKNQIIQKVVEQSIVEAKLKNIKGKEITPFLLSRIEQITEGESLKSNIQLVLNNARLASKIAVELATLC